MNKKQFNILSDYLFFIQRRNRNSNNYFTTVNFKASKFTEELIDSLGKDYKIYNPKAEIAYLSLKAKEFFQPGEKFDESIKIQVLTLDLIEKVSADLDIDLTYDYSLFKNLSEHLQRIFFEGSVRTPENIEVQLLFDTNQNLASIVEKNINELEKILKKRLSVAEISYIMIYLSISIEEYYYKNYSKLRVAVVTDSGVGIEILLKSKLEKEFNFNIVGVFNSRNLSELKENDIDIIISTINIESSDTGYIKISPLLLDEELKKIKAVSKNIIDEISRYEVLDLKDKKEKVIEKNITYEPKRISDFLEDGFIQLDVEATDWKDAIYKASLNLLEKEYITEEYIYAMIKNIEDNGPYIVVSKGFSIAHAKISSGVMKTGFNLIRLKNSVSFETGTIFDPVKYICVIAATDKKKHLNALFEIINLFQDVEFREKLDKLERSEDIIDLIRHKEEEWKTN